MNLLNLEGLDQSMAYVTERTKRKPDPIREILCILGSMFTLTQVSTLSRASLQVNTEEDWPGGPSPEPNSVELDLSCESYH